MSINAEVNGVGLFPLVLFQSLADCFILENIQRVFVFEPPLEIPVLVFETSSQLESPMDFIWNHTLYI